MPYCSGNGPQSYFSLALLSLSPRKNDASMFCLLLGMCSYSIYQYFIIIIVWSIYQVALVVKNLPTNVGKCRSWVGSLNGEDPLEEEMATHSSILAWEIPWTEKPGGLQSTGPRRVGQDWANTRSTLSHHCVFPAPGRCLPGSRPTVNECSIEYLNRVINSPTFVSWKASALKMLAFTGV